MTQTDQTTDQTGQPQPPPDWAVIKTAEYFHETFTSSRAAVEQAFAVLAHVQILLRMRALWAACRNVGDAITPAGQFFIRAGSADDGRHSGLIADVLNAESPAVVFLTGNDAIVAGHENIFYISDERDRAFLCVMLGCTNEQLDEVVANIDDLFEFAAMAAEAELLDGDVTRSAHELLAGVQL